MTNFEADLLSACAKFAVSTYAWCILPNHYHVLARTDDIEALRHWDGCMDVPLSVGMVKRISVEERFGSTASIG